MQVMTIIASGRSHIFSTFVHPCALPHRFGCLECDVAKPSATNLAARIAAEMADRINTFMRSLQAPSLLSLTNSSPAASEQFRVHSLCPQGCADDGSGNCQIGDGRSQKRCHAIDSGADQ